MTSAVGWKATCNTSGVEAKHLDLWKRLPCTSSGEGLTCLPVYLPPQNKTLKKKKKKKNSSILGTETWNRCGVVWWCALGLVRRDSSSGLPAAGVTVGEWDSGRLGHPSLNSNPTHATTQPLPNCLLPSLPPFFFPPHCYQKECLSMLVWE